MFPLEACTQATVVVAVGRDSPTPTPQAAVAQAGTPGMVGEDHTLERMAKVGVVVAEVLARIHITALEGVVEVWAFLVKARMEPPGMWAVVAVVGKAA